MMTRKIILICVIVVGVVLVALVLNFYYGLRKMYRYEFYYDKYGMMLHGKTVDGKIMFNIVTINLQQAKEKNILLKLSHKTYKLSDITINDMKLLGAKCENKKNTEPENEVKYVLSSLEGFNPPHSFSLKFTCNNAYKLGLYIAHPPQTEMGEIKEVFLGLIFPESYFLRLPVARNEIEAKFGKPDNIRRYIIFP